MADERKIIVEMAVSADGFIARLDGSVDWLDRPEPKGGYGMGEFYKSIDTILWGRKTYDMARSFQEKGVPGSAFDISRKNYVFTHTLSGSAAPPGIEFVHESVPAFAARLHGMPGKNIWMMGGAGIIGSFLDAGEIDEFSLTVIPTFIGEGIPFMTPRHRTVPLKLIESKPFSDGVVKLHYAVEKEPASRNKQSRQA
jgi:dihydrofolate reductase